MQLENVYFEAVKTALLASEEILKFYNAEYHKECKNDGSPVTEADIASSKVILRELAKTCIPIISEEERNSSFSERKNWSQVWIVDPLDGTKEFIKKNGEFVVNIALVENGAPVFGVIASPVNQNVLFGGDRTGCFFSTFEDVFYSEKWTRLESKVLNSPIVLTSSRAPYQYEETNLIEEISKVDAIEYIKKGSALKFFDLAMGRADVYPRFAPTMEWDIAAGQAILEALGGEIIDALTGKSLCYNKESLFNPSFIAKTKGFIDTFDSK